ncbi:hypothetical protein PATSB16_29520 [Pandoraea thiooxydans]|nr:hypothetical protein PATSB16_29520 [Pandoraea thiooxydans]
MRPSASRHAGIVPRTVAKINGFMMDHLPGDGRRIDGNRDFRAIDIAISASYYLVINVLIQLNTF